MNKKNLLVGIGFGAVFAAVGVSLAAILLAHDVQQAKLWQVAGLIVAVSATIGAYWTLVRPEDVNRKQQVPPVVVFDSVAFTIAGLVVVSFTNSTDPRRWASTVIWSLACLAIGAITGFLFAIPRSRRESRPTTVPARRASKGNPNAQGSTGLTAIGSPPLGSPAFLDAGSPPLGSPPISDDSADDSGSPDNQPSISVADPTPIEQISDWLTKIIVGLGLADLRDLPHLFKRWSQFVALSIGPLDGGAFGNAADIHASSFALGLILYFLILGFLACYILTQIFLGDLINRNG